MPVTATLVDDGGDPISIDDVALEFFERDYDTSSVSPLVEGLGAQDTILVSNFEGGFFAEVTGNWPAPLSVSEFTDPLEVLDWLDRAGNRTVETLRIERNDYVLTIDFDGQGPSLRDFVEEFNEAALLDLGPEINGVAVGDGGDVGTPGDDTLIGTGGADDISGLAGNDRIDGRGGRDELDGGRGNDDIRGGRGNDDIDGDAGRDRLDGGAGNDDMDGGSGRDALAGGAGRDRLEGGTGNDVLRGGSGRDTIVEQAGDDRMFGGGGADRFVFSDDESFGVDRILDFAVGTDEIIIRTDLPRRFGDRGDRLTGEALDPYLEFIQDFGTEITFRGDGILLEGPIPETSTLDITFTSTVTEEAFWDSVTVVLL